MADARPLSVSERENLRNTIQELDRQVRGGRRGDVEFRPDSLQQSQETRERIQRNQAILDRDPGEARGAERARIERRLREIEPGLRRGLVSCRDQRVRPDDPRFEQVVRMQSEVQRRSPEYHEWQNQRRRLDPSDPGVSNVDRHLRSRT